MAFLHGSRSRACCPQTLPLFTFLDQSLSRRFLEHAVLEDEKKSTGGKNETQNSLDHSRSRRNRGRCRHRGEGELPQWAWMVRPWSMASPRSAELCVPPTEAERCADRTGPHHLERGAANGG